MPSSLASLKATTSLFEVWKLKRRACSATMPSGLARINLAPVPPVFADLSTRSVQASGGMGLDGSI